jgi:hypothetical protein
MAPVGSKVRAWSTRPEHRSGPRPRSGSGRWWPWPSSGRHSHGSPRPRRRGGARSGRPRHPGGGRTRSARQAGEAQPVHRPAPADQHDRAAVRQQSVITDRQAAHQGFLAFGRERPGDPTPPPHPLGGQPARSSEGTGQGVARARSALEQIHHAGDLGPGARRSWFAPGVGAQEAADGEEPDRGEDRTSSTITAPPGPQRQATPATNHVLRRGPVACSVLSSPPSSRARRSLPRRRRSTPSARRRSATWSLHRGSPRR